MRNLISLLVAALFAGLFTGCEGPAKREFNVDANSTETLFVMALEKGTDGAATQAKLEAGPTRLREKRVNIPMRKWVYDWGDGKYKWLATVATIRVDTQPVTREWTSSTETGTTAKDEALLVKSKDGVLFKLGATIRALIQDPDTDAYLSFYGTHKDAPDKDKKEDANYILCNYHGRPLAEVVDTDVHNYCQSRLSRYFGLVPLVTGRGEAPKYFEQTLEDARVFFKRRGITIANFGSSEGLGFVNGEVQNAIDRRFLATKDQEIALQEEEKAAKANKRLVEMAEADRDAAIVFQNAFEAMVLKVNMECRTLRAARKMILAEKWTGDVPSIITPPSGSSSTGSGSMPMILQVK